MKTQNITQVTYGPFMKKTAFHAFCVYCDSLDNGSVDPVIAQEKINFYALYL